MVAASPRCELLCKNVPTIRREGIGTEGRKDHEDSMGGEGKLISNSLPVKGFRRQFPDEERPVPEIGISFVAIKMGHWSGLGRTAEPDWQ